MLNKGIPGRQGSPESHIYSYSLMLRSSIRDINPTLDNTDTCLVGDAYHAHRADSTWERHHEVWSSLTEHPFVSDHPCCSTVLGPRRRVFLSRYMTHEKGISLWRVYPQRISCVASQSAQ